MTVTKSRNVYGPGIDWVSVTPDNDVDLPDGVPLSLWVNVPGDICLVSVSGNEETFTVEVAGPVDLQPARVKATGTDATGIKAIY